MLVYCGSAYPILAFIPPHSVSPFPFLTQFLKFIYIYIIYKNLYFIYILCWVLFICLSHLLFLGLQINGRSHMTPTSKLRAL